MHRRQVIAAGALLPLISAGTAAAAADGGSFSTDGHVALKAYKGLVEEHLAGALNALRVLAATSDAQAGEWPRTRPALKALEAGLTSAAAVWYAQPDGAYYTTAGDRAADSLGDREYFPKVMAGADVEGSLVISKSTGHRSVIVATPVRTGSRVVGALGVSIRARRLGALVEERTNLPDDLVFYAIDARGQTAIHKDPDRMFAFPSDMGDESLKAAVKTMLSSSRGSVSYRFQGTSRIALFEESELTAWRFVLAKIVG
ncbi:MAG: cache domain-containing protein [Chromatiales bacterium]|jgi:methyl-accepting chemotaxis protein|nr:cache domain-containing protein [Chromatiales bacterium]